MFRVTRAFPVRGRRWGAEQAAATEPTPMPPRAHSCVVSLAGGRRGDIMWAV